MKKFINTESDLAINRTFRELEQSGKFDISPCDDITNIEDNPKFKKIELSSAQKIQMSALASQLPAVVAANTMTSVSQIPNLYSLTFPKGLPHTLMNLKQGGYSTSVMVNGKIAATASLSPFDISQMLSAQAMMLSTFSAMSVVSGQYFLKEINSKMTQINQSVDKILGFLYGDKKAEMMAELDFVKYAYQNYSTIMSNESQRIATITSLQQARKIAFKDSQFYIEDLESIIKSDCDIVQMVNSAFNTKESLELALQLCIMSSIMEVHYSQNFDESYLKYIDDNVSFAIRTCKNKILGSFNGLERNIANHKGNPLKKINKTPMEEEVKKVIKKFSDGGEWEMSELLHAGLYSSSRISEYYLSKAGDVYLKLA